MYARKSSFSALSPDRLLRPSELIWPAVLNSCILAMLVASAERYFLVEAKNLETDYSSNMSILRVQNLIRVSNLDFWINLDPDVLRIAPKMYWIYSLVGLNHFAKYHKNRLLTVWEIIINLLKSPIGERNGQLIRNPYPTPDHHQKLITSRESPLAHAFCLPRFVNISYGDLELSCSQNDRQNYRSHYCANLGGNKRICSRNAIYVVDRHNCSLSTVWTRVLTARKDSLL